MYVCITIIILIILVISIDSLCIVGILFEHLYLINGIIIIIIIRTITYALAIQLLFIVVLEALLMYDFQIASIRFSAFVLIVTNDMIIDTAVVMIFIICSFSSSGSNSSSIIMNA